MKNSTEKQFLQTVPAVTFAVIGFLAPLVAQAEGSSGNSRIMIAPGSEVEVGVGYVSEDSFKFGDYGRGLQESGTFLIGNIRMNARDRDNPGYLELNGRNLGLDGARDFGIKTGVQGNYGLTFEYGELSKLYSDTFMSPYNGLGTSRLTAPAGWAGTIDSVPGGAITPPGPPTIVTTAMMTALAANMKQFNVETKRKAEAVGLTKRIAEGWDVALNFKRENRDGTKLTGAAFQIGGQGNRGVALVPEPINYTTDLFDTMARYAGKKLHMQVGYHFSQFKNSNESLVFDNLFYNSASTVGGNALTGRLGQMPDNNFHQVNASGGYTISTDTRLTGALSLGRTTQNEAFLPYSTAAAPAALPAGSLHGKVSTTHTDIKLASKLTHDLNFVAGYKYDDRDNRTPVNTYTYQTADITTPAGASNTRQNTPLSKKQRSIYADMDYHLSAATKLKLGYDLDKATHTYEPTAGDRERTVRAEVKHRISDRSSAGLAYAHSDRKSDPYDGAGSLASTYTAAYLASLCVAPNTFLYNGVVTNCTGVASATSNATTPFLDTPALRKFFLADRKRSKVHAFANLAAAQKLDLQFGASYYRDKYPDTETGFGLTLARGFALNFDANLAATEEVSEVFFTSFDSNKTHQNGHNGASSATFPVITSLDRQNNTVAFDALTGVASCIDRSLTVGFGFRVKPGGSFDWGGDFTHVNTRGSTGFLDVGSRLTILPVPDDFSRLNRLELFGKFKLQKDLALNVKYAFEKYDSTNWAWDGQTYTSSSSLIGSGQTSPDYTVNVTSVSLSYVF